MRLAAAAFGPNGAGPAGMAKPPPGSGSGSRFANLHRMPSYMDALRTPSPYGATPSPPLVGGHVSPPTVGAAGVAPGAPGGAGAGAPKQMDIRCKFGQLGNDVMQFNSPHGFCLGPGEEIIVADTQNHRIQVRLTFNYPLGTGVNSRLTGV